MNKPMSPERLEDEEREEWLTALRADLQEVRENPTSLHAMAAPYAKDCIRLLAEVDRLNAKVALHRAMVADPFHDSTTP